MSEKIYNPLAKPPAAPIEPLKRVLVPIEFNGHFQTTDGAVYERRPNGQIRRMSPKFAEFRKQMKRNRRAKTTA